MLAITVLFAAFNHLIEFMREDFTGRGRPSTLLFMPVGAVNRVNGQLQVALHYSNGSVVLASNNDDNVRTYPVGSSTACEVIGLALPLALLPTIDVPAADPSHRFDSQRILQDCHMCALVIVWAPCAYSPRVSIV
jgi:hypothetical protein